MRLLARKLGIDLARVRGTGPHGRILLDDLTPYPRPKAGAGRHPRGSPAPISPKLDLGVAGHAA